MATKYRRYVDITAQAINVRALMLLYSNLEHKQRLPLLDTPKNGGLVPFVVFLAFAIESYLNSLGSRYIQSWDDLERLPWKAKVAILHEMARKPHNWSSPQLQFAKEVFKLRDRLAHGKPERVYDETPVNAGEWGHVPPDDLWPQWYKNITLAWVISSKDKFRGLMIYLGDLFGLHESDHLLSSTGDFEPIDGR